MERVRAAMRRKRDRAYWCASMNKKRKLKNLQRSALGISHHACSLCSKIVLSQDRLFIKMRFVWQVHKTRKRLRPTAASFAGQNKQRKL